MKTTSLEHNVHHGNAKPISIHTNRRNVYTHLQPSNTLYTRTKHKYKIEICFKTLKHVGISLSQNVPRQADGNIIFQCNNSATGNDVDGERIKQAIHHA